MHIFLNHIITKNTPTYGNSSMVGITKSRSIDKGDTSNEHHLEFNNHIGTHIDAPFHFDNSGKSLDQYPADFWICNFPVLIQKKFEPKEIITLNKLKDEFSQLNSNIDCILLKTGFEIFRPKKEIYSFQNPSIDPEIPIYLRNNFQLKFLGIDYISISSRENREMGRNTHKAFLCKSYMEYEFSSSPILLIEDMHLEFLYSSPRKLYISPLLFENSDGSPVTIIAELEDI